jgi:hypothetical protein
MQTERDAEIVGWVGRLGAAGAEHMMARFDMGRSWAYSRLNTLMRDGLLQQARLLHLRPGLYMATREGLRWRGLERLGIYRVTPGGFAHAWELASTAVALNEGLPGWELLSDRELRVVEADRGQLLACASLGELPGGRPALHRPDLALLGPHGRVVAVEVELSVKASRRLAAICRGYARARHIDHVYYFAPSAVARAVGRAVAETRSEDRITVLPLGAIPVLADAEGRAGDVRG